MAQQQEQENYTEEDLFPTPKRKERPKRVEVYAETTFDGADLSRHVHIGWGVCLGGAMVLACMAMSAFTQARSWNVSFRWLQRRVGVQFGTMSYMMTTNALFYWDGDKWCARDWARKWNLDPGLRGFAASGAQQA